MHANDATNPAALPDFDIEYRPQFFTESIADSLFRQLRDDTPWTQHAVMLFGQKRPAPRLSSWHGDADASYRYSGIRYEPLPNTPALDTVQDALRAIGLAFNSVLCNYYRNGTDSMGWHSDDEPELGAEPLIASVSFGATRRFCFRHKTLGLKHELMLTHGSLLIMRARTQHAWQHAIPKTARPLLRCGDPARINLTFRRVYSR